jgi:stage II sporulation protein D
MRRFLGMAGVGVAVAGSLWLMLGSCTPPAVPGVPAPAPAVPGTVEAATAEPEIRIGLAVGASTGTIGGGSELVVTDPAGAYLARIAAGEIWRLAITGSGLAVISPGGGSSASTTQLGVIPLDSGVPVLFNGHPYRGDVTVLRDRTGMTVVNRVPLETYLQGVVSAEMGRRSPAEQEALRAQAVVSRTYALRNMGRWRAEGFDFQATVADQVYGGVQAENPLAMQAVRETRGQVITAGGAPIDAFFFSTCGGHTADGTEAFRGAERSYLRSIADVDASGVAYCSISPRFRWHEEWSGEALRATLRRTLPAVMGTPVGQVREVRDVRVTGITGSGRVGRLTITLDRSRVDVDGPQIRQVLRPATGDMLRSNTFTLTVTGAGRRVTRLTADGAGAGHGVGFCQWGAVGRSRAGQDYQRIVAAYYPGAVLDRLY